MAGNIKIAIGNPVVLRSEPRLEIERSFLGCEKMAEIIEVRKTYSGVLKGIIGIVLEDLLKTKYSQYIPDIRMPKDFEKTIRDCYEINMGGAEIRFADKEELWHGKPYSRNFNSGACSVNVACIDHLLVISKEGGRFILDIVGHDKEVVSFCVSVAQDQLDAVNGFFADLENGFKRMKGVFTGYGERLIMEKKKNWNEVVLRNEIIEMIDYNVTGFMKEENRAFLKDNSIPIKRGLLFYGPPGNGKTLTGKIISSQTDTCFILCSNKSFSFHWKDDDISRIYSLAKAISPSIVFLEDIDLIIGNNEHRLGMLLQELDGIEENENVITIATTNHPEAIDEALGRPGRFDIRIEFPNPDLEARLKLLGFFTKNMVLDKSVDFDEIAERTEDFSCAALKEVVTRSLVIAYEARSIAKGKVVVRKEHFEGASDFVQRAKGLIGFVP